MSVIDNPRTTNSAQPIKVGFICGSVTHQRHTQMYVGGDPRYEFIAVGSRKCDLGESDILLPHRRLNTLRDVLRPIPKLRHKVSFFEQQRFFGFEKALSDIDIFFPGGSIFPFSYQSILMKRKYGAKVVVLDLENVPFSYQHMPERLQAQRRAVLRECDAIIATTDQVKRCMMMEGVPEEKISVVFFGVRSDIFTPGPKNPEILARLGVSENDIVVTYIGEFSWRKGPHSLLYAAKCFKNDPEIREAPVKFVFMGPHANAIRAQVQLLGLADRVIVSDWMGYDCMPDVYRSSDIVVVPSIPTPDAYEQGSCVLLESGSSGRMIVASQTGAIPELLGDAGLYFPPADYWSLYLTLKELVSDEKKREYYGKRVREHAVAHWDSGLTREKTIRVFDEVLSRG